MTIARSDVAIAEARMLIENRAAWPVAPLIGAGATWLRPGTIARMADEMAETDDAMGTVREAVPPDGRVGRAQGTLEQHRRLRLPLELRSSKRWGSHEAAMALQAETAMPDDAAWQKLRGQFEGLALGPREGRAPGTCRYGWTAWAARAGRPWRWRRRWGADRRGAGRALGPAGLDARLAEIELAQSARSAARIVWLRNGTNIHCLPVGDSRPAC